jgi:SAM-dependent methyltransferase
MTVDPASLRAFYLDNAGTEQSMFHIWENGGARGDSVTPSTYSSGYREWMTNLLAGLLAESDTPALLSVGCGNAAVEAVLAAAGYQVLAVDALPEAVTLARNKGVDAVCADVLTWTPPFQRWGVIYADGLLGHLYDPATGLAHVIERFASWLLPHTGVLVISNDGPRSHDETEPHPDVPGFAWLSCPYICGQLGKAGFQDISSASFTYERPLSGPRDRVIVTARPAEAATSSLTRRGGHDWPAHSWH